MNNFDNDMIYAIEASLKSSNQERRTCAIDTLRDSLIFIKNEELFHQDAYLNELIRIFSSEDRRDYFFTLVKDETLTDFTDESGSSIESLELGLNKGDEISADAIHNAFKVCPFIEYFDIEFFSNNPKDANYVSFYNIERNNSIGLIKIMWESNPDHWSLFSGKVYELPETDMVPITQDEKIIENQIKNDDEFSISINLMELEIQNDDIIRLEQLNKEIAIIEDILQEEDRMDLQIKSMEFITILSKNI